MPRLSLALTLAILSILVAGNTVTLSDDAHAQEDSKITVQTDRENYEFDYPDPPIVIISGNVSRDILSEGEYVVIQVLNPMDARYRVDFVNVTASDGSFEYHMPIGGPIADISGEYAVLVNYRGTYQAETSFQYDNGATIRDYLCMITLCTHEITISNITHVINYRMAGIIKNVTADVEKKSLILDLENYGSEMRMALPKELIRAEDEQGNDTEFIIFVDGKESVYSDLPEKAAGQYRSLGITENLERYRVISIGFEEVETYQRIEIVGTWVAPEFSSSLVIAIVMVTSIAAVIAWSKWNTVPWKR